jgi:hypothetical protein
MRNQLKADTKIVGFFGVDFYAIKRISRGLLKN